MAKGKGKGKKKKQDAGDANAQPTISEVDKTFYELQITDLNRKLARLRELTANLEEKNTELEQKYVQLDEDRADVIAFLKKQLSEKQNEASELQERLFALQEAKDNEAIQFEEKVKEMNEEYRIMKEQLTSEIKLLSGKLNALEEFRIHRDELMKKYLDQEKAIEEQEIRHKRTLYEAEKMYIMSKDTIKKDMEKRIIQLAKDFQNANEIRIAATTHRLIRENISVNNVLDSLQEIIERLTKDNEELKLKNRNLQQNCDLYTEERNIALDKSKIHSGIITQLKHKYKQLNLVLQSFKKEVKAARDKEQELTQSKRDIENLKYKIIILEQNLHANKCEAYAAKKMQQNAELKSQHLKNILFESVDAIEQSLRITLNEADESERYSKRESLLYYLLRLINEGHQEIVRCESSDTVESVKAAYIRGDLGFVPMESVPLKKKLSSLKGHMDTQVGQSLEDLQKSVVEIEQTVSHFTMPFVSETVVAESEELSEEEFHPQSKTGSSESAVMEFDSKKSLKSKVMFSGVIEQSAYDVTLSKIDSIEATIEDEEHQLSEEFAWHEDEKLPEEDPEQG